MNRGSYLVAGIAALAFGISVVSSPAAAACDSDTAIFEDEFAFMDVSWGEPDETFYVEDGRAIIETLAGVVNFSTKNTGGTVCVDLTILEAPNIQSSAAGPVFWWQDWKNYYTLFVWADGWIEVRRAVNGELQVLFTKEVPALKKGVGKTNHIELELGPKDATIFINGEKVQRFKGKPPRDGGPIGIYGASPEEQPATFAFDNLLVNARRE